MDRPPHRVLSLFSREGEGKDKPRSERPPGAPRERPKSVSQLLGELRMAIGREFQGVLVEGEVQQFKIWRGNAGQRAYFDLKDRGSQITCTIPSDVLVRLPFDIEDGMQVLIRGNVAEYRSRLQLVVKRIKPRGEGELALAFQQLKQKLAAEGLFDDERKRPLPLLPQTVGVVTSPQGAAVKDFVKVLRARLPGVSVLLSPTTVQGRESAPNVVAALERLDNSGRCDVILIGRGGGSLEDLWAFNTPEVVRAIAACETPVVSAVGHESDVTLSDLVADVRAATPSHAAERAVPRYEDLTHRVDALARRLEHRARAHKERAELRLRRASGRLADPRVLLRPAERRLATLAGRLDAALDARTRAARDDTSALAARLREVAPAAQVAERRRALERVRADLDAAMEAQRHKAHRALASGVAKLHALSPLSVLDRGYALVTRAGDAALVADANALTTGDRVRVRFRDGAASAVIEQVDVDSGAAADEGSAHGEGEEDH
jgi:exodeoxyribonuclease VII large subunit